MCIYIHFTATSAMQQVVSNMLDVANNTCLQSLQLVGDVGLGCGAPTFYGPEPSWCGVNAGGTRGLAPIRLRHKGLR